MGVEYPCASYLALQGVVGIIVISSAGAVLRSTLEVSSKQMPASIILKHNASEGICWSRKKKLRSSLD